MSVDAPASSTRTVPASVVSSVFVLIWASGFVAARFVAPHAEAFTFVAIRLVGVAIVLTAITLGLGARWPRSRAGWRDALVAGVLMQGIYVIGVFWSGGARPAIGHRCPGRQSPAPADGRDGASIPR